MAEHDCPGFKVLAGGHGVGLQAVAGLTVDAVDLSTAVAEEFSRRIGPVGGGVGPMIAAGDRAILLVERGVGLLLNLRLGPYMRHTDVRVVQSGQVIELPPSYGATWHSAMRTLCAPRGHEVVPALAGACTAVTETVRGLRIGRPG
jgi:hypothetical protein